MRLFADENVPGVVVRMLREAGHDVSWGCEAHQGASDADRLQAAYSEHRMVLTEDSDFTDLVLKKGSAARGVIRFSLFGLGRDAKARRIVAACRGCRDGLWNDRGH